MGISLKDRQRLLAGLDRVEGVVAAVYRAILVLIIAAILGGTAFVVVRRPWGAGHQGEWFYFTIAVLLALGWAVGQYVALGRRQRRRELMELPVTIRAHHQEGAQGWELRCGSSSGGAADSLDSGAAGGGTGVELSGGFQIPLGSLARNVLPDEAALARLQAELDAGSDFHEACRTIQPAYEDWNTLAQWAYRTYATGLLEQQRRDATPSESDG